MESEKTILSDDNKFIKKSIAVGIAGGIIAERLINRYGMAKTVINKDTNEDLKKGGVDRIGSPPDPNFQEQGQLTSPPENKKPPVIKTVPQPSSPVFELEYPTTKVNQITQEIVDDIENFIDDDTKYKTTMMLIGIVGVIGLFAVTQN